MKHSKQLEAIKKIASKEPKLVKLNQALANELFNLRELRPRVIQLDWLLIWYRAFEFISNEFDLHSSGIRVIQVNSKTGELLSGSAELAAFIISGRRTIKLYIFFPNPTLYDFIDIGQNRQ